MKYKASVVRNHKCYIRFFCGTLEHDVLEIELHFRLMGEELGTKTSLSP